MEPDAVYAEVVVALEAVVVVLSGADDGRPTAGALLTLTPEGPAAVGVRDEDEVALVAFGTFGVCPGESPEELRVVLRTDFPVDILWTVRHIGRADVAEEGLDVLGLFLAAREAAGAHDRAEEDSKEAEDDERRLLKSGNHDLD